MDHLEEADGVFTAAQVDDFVAEGFIGEEGAAGDVVDVGEIAALGTVAVELDRIALVDPLDEAVGGHIRATGGSVDGEIAEDGDVESEEMMVSIGKDFCGFFGSGVGGDGLVNWEGFAKGHGLAGVEGGSRGEDELRDLVVTHGFEEV